MEVVAHSEREEACKLEVPRLSCKEPATPAVLTWERGFLRDFTLAGGDGTLQYKFLIVLAPIQLNIKILSRNCVPQLWGRNDSI